MRVFFFSEKIKARIVKCKMQEEEDVSNKTSQDYQHSLEVIRCSIVMKMEEA
jgi:hypothetical protein